MTREELEALKDGFFARLNPLDTNFKLLKQNLETYKTAVDEKFGYNGKSHENLREEIEEIERQIKSARPAIEWVMGIRRAWGKIVFALILSGVLTAAAGLLKLYAFYKIFVGGVTP